MYIQLVLSFIITFVISNIYCIEEPSALINCSSNDLNCIQNNVLNNVLNNNQTIRDDKNSSFRENCISGQTYFDLNVGECRNCSTKCPTNAYIHKMCNGSHNTQCICKTGYFMAVDLSCKPCSQCESGWGVWRTCRWSRNTVCRKCPPGTYSGVQTGTLGCILCTKCNSNEELLEECSGVHDSICIDRTLKFSLNDTNEDYILRNEGNALPIYFTILIVIILSLITYVLIQLRIKKMMKLSPTISPQQTYKYPTYYYHLYRPDNNNQRQQNFNQFKKNNTTFSQLNTSSEKEKMNNNFIAKRYCELNSSLKRAFEMNLNQNNTDSQQWKSLAKELGYSCASISAFECLGKQRSNAIHYFLSDWSKYEDATINSLLKALLRIGRIDCALIIDPTVTFSPY